MSQRLFDEWRSEWRLKRGLTGYVAALMSDPDPSDVDWLAAAATSGDTDRAAWELRYARRALGMVVSQRDALDDRTSSLVARELAAAQQADRKVAPAMLKVAERQFNDRLSAYRDVLTSRVPSEGTGARLGRTLLQISGAARAPDDLIARAAEILARYVGEANEALRLAFGAPTLPPDALPSAPSP
ncbi:MAG: hypothetical protein ABI910_23060 [Gemmatimonadota bacterium]